MKKEKRKDKRFVFFFDHFFKFSVQTKHQEREDHKKKKRNSQGPSNSHSCVIRDKWASPLYARLRASLLSTGGVVLGIVLLLGEERAVALGNGGVDGGGDLDLQTDHKRRQKKEEEKERMKVDF